MADKFRTESTPLTGSVLYTIRLPNALWFAAEVQDCIRDMTYEFNWIQEGNVTTEQAANASSYMYMSFQPMTGQIIAYCASTLPGNALACDGSTHLRVDYPNLYAALDIAFIVDSDHFVTPDLRGKTVIGASASYAIGDTGGESEHELTVLEMPEHGHSDAGHYHSVGGSVGALAVAPGELPVLAPSLPTLTGVGNASISNTGGSQAHNNMQPYIALKYAIIY